MKHTYYGRDRVELRFSYDEYMLDSFLTFFPPVVAFPFRNMMMVNDE
jgi:hypothetical protein